jgi:UDP-N-acetylmuramate dehydrogenase
MSSLIKKDVIMAPFTSWQIGGPADYFCEPTQLEELRSCYHWALSEDIPVTIIGGGSNVLISDEGVQGLVICMRKFVGLNVRVESSLDKIIITAAGGVKKSDLLKIFLKYKLAPALFLAGLPGDVAGGVVMNAGVSEPFEPREFGEIVDWIEVLRPSGDVVRITHDEMRWSYRKVTGWQPGIIVQAQLSWELQEIPGIFENVKEANRIRLLKQPLDLPSCGSVFKNPGNQKAAQLIDKAGLKGYSIGEAQVSLKHANFIVNLGQAKARDTWALMTHVQDEILRQFGVKLETEVIRIGRW